MHRLLVVFSVIAIFFPMLTLAASSCPAGRVCLDNPLQTSQKKDALTATDIIGTIIKGAIGIIGALTFVMFLYGGWLWLSSAGNTEKIEQGTQTMTWAAIGVVLVFASYLILSTFISAFTK